MSRRPSLLSIVDPSVTKPNLPPGAPEKLVRERFRQNLFRLMTRKGWNQSELGRAAGIGRDAISTYLRGRSIPEPKNAAKLAQALGVDLMELIPTVDSLGAPPPAAYAPPAEPRGPLEINSTEDPGTVFVRLSMALPWSVVLELQQLVAPHLPAAAKGPQAQQG